MTPIQSRVTMPLLGLVILAAPVVGQEPRLAGRLPAEALATIDSVLASAQARRLPTEPLVDRALEGIAKRAPADLVSAAVIRLAGELEIARGAFGDSASVGELTAGASALRAGATGEQLQRLRALRSDRPLTVAASVLADLVAVGVPSDTAIAAVMALAEALPDREYIAFRQNVERDIAQGASPTAALGVRLEFTSRALGDALAPSSPGTDGASTPKRRKP